jgi:hypothetical protein
MRATPWLAGLALVAVVLGGCAGGAVIKPPSVGPGSKFCTAVTAFGTAADPFNNAGADNRTTLLPLVSGMATTLKSLQAQAPSADTVNGKSLKADIGTMATTMQDLATQLQQSTDAKVTLNAVNAKDGQAFTDAVGRFDAYAGTVCKVTGPATSLATTSTTGAIGPTAP